MTREKMLARKETPQMESYEPWGSFREMEREMERMF